MAKQNRKAGSVGDTIQELDDNITSDEFPFRRRVVSILTRLEGELELVKTENEALKETLREVLRI